LRQRHDILLLHGRSPYLGMFIPSARRPENILQFICDRALAPET